MAGTVVAVAKDKAHRFSKLVSPEIVLVSGLGVEGDAHQGAEVRHRSRVAADPTQPNLRQVHLIHSELFDDLAARGFRVVPGDLGENITTAGVDLLALPKGAILKIGDEVELVVTGLRNPCAQIERFQKGLLNAVLFRDTDGRLNRKTGIMSVVTAGGVVRKDDAITVMLPPLPHTALEVV